MVRRVWGAGVGGVGVVEGGGEVVVDDVGWVDLRDGVVVVGVEIVGDVVVECGVAVEMEAGSEVEIEVVDLESVGRNFG